MRIANGRSSLHNGVLIRRRTKNWLPVETAGLGISRGSWMDEDEFSLSFLPYLNSYVDLEQFIYWLFYWAVAYTTLIIIIYTLRIAIYTENTDM